MDTSARLRSPREAAVGLVRVGAVGITWTVGGVEMGDVEDDLVPDVFGDPTSVGDGQVVVDGDEEGGVEPVTDPTDPRRFDVVDASMAGHSSFDGFGG